MIRAVVLALVCALVMSACGEDHLLGTELEKNMAPDFTLTDGVSGKSVTLSSLRKKTVALAFLYTRCPDVCPLTASQFRAAQRSLGDDASKVDFVAVSVDPEGDTPAAVREFSSLHDLSERWHYLIDGRGRERAILHSSDPTNWLLDNLRALIRERSD